MPMRVRRLKAKTRSGNPQHRAFREIDEGLGVEADAEREGGCHDEGEDELGGGAQGVAFKRLVHEHIDDDAEIVIEGDGGIQVKAAISIMSAQRWQGSVYS